MAQALLRAFDESGIIGPVVKYLAHRLTGGDPVRAMRRLARRWSDGRPPSGGRVQHLFSADGTVDEKLLQLALALGPQRYYGVHPRADAPTGQPT